VASRLTLLHAELQRRKVYRVAALYCAAGAGIIGVAEPLLGEAVWTGIKIPLVIIIIIGFPVALVLAWLLQVKREEAVGTEGTGLAPSSGPSEDPGLSIVVLPFDNLSPDPNDAYFSDGLTEEIIADLSISQSLRVISRSSAMVLKGTQKDVRTIGKELGVQYVLEGSVRKAGDNLRITAQLIDAVTDHHLWAEKYDGVLDDIFSIQETVSRSIVDALRLKLNPGEEERLAERPIPDVRAYELYLKARQGIYSFNKEKLEAAEVYLKEALEISGENAVLIYQHAHLHYQFWNAGIRLDEEDLRMAREYADRALALDPGSPDHLVIRGLLEVTGGDGVRGYRYMEAALDRDPNHADALFWSPAISAFFGREVEAKARLAQLRKIDPLNPFGSVFLVWIELKKGRFSSAVDLALRFRKTISLEPLLEGVYAIALAQTDRPKEAVTVIREVFGHSQGMIARGFSALACAFEGDRDGVLGLLDSEFERWAEKDFQYSEWAAQSLAQVGERDRAMDWLENSVARGNINFPYLNEYDSFLSNVRDQPRFQALMERVKSEWDSFEV
jgi:TolB-like protein